MPDLEIAHGTRVAPEALWQAVSALDCATDDAYRARRLLHNFPQSHLESAVANVFELSRSLHLELKECIQNYIQKEAETEQAWADFGRAIANFNGICAGFGFWMPTLYTAEVIGIAYLFGPRTWAISLTRESVESSDVFLNRAFGGRVPRAKTAKDAPAVVSAAVADTISPGSGDTNVVVRNVSTGTTPPPETVEELVRRIPQGDAQIRIERYGTEGDYRYIVYVEGTRDIGFGGPEPFDMLSNLQAVGGESSAGQSAIESALRYAGVRPGDRVMFIGHSQGALDVARVAQSGTYRVEQIVAAGGPLGTVDDAAPTLALQINEDPIGSITGDQAPDSSRITVRTDAPLPLNPLDPLAGHALPQYEQVAAKVDQSGDPEVKRAEQRIADFASGPGHVTLWTAERESAAQARKISAATHSWRMPSHVR